MDQFDSQKDDDRSLGPISTGPAPDAGRISFFTTPLSRHGWPVWAVYFASLIGLIYILNPTMGVLELLPDNLPLVGNLDEGAAFMLIWFGLMEFFENRKQPPSNPS